MIRKSLEFTPEKEGLADGQFAGYASTWDMDDVGDVIEKGAFIDTIPEFLNAGVIAWQHDWREPIGKPNAAREDQKGLYIVGDISDTTRGRDALTLMRDGVVKKLSIGFDILESTTIGEEEAAEKYGGSQPNWWGGYRKISKVKLYEVSLVSVPANPSAIITDVKGLGSEPFGEHTKSVGAALEEYVARLKWHVQRRTSENRRLSKTQQDDICQIITQHEQILRELKSLAMVPDDMAMKELARFYAINAKINGVTL